MRHPKRHRDLTLLTVRANAALLGDSAGAHRGRHPRRPRVHLDGKRRAVRARRPSRQPRGRHRTAHPQTPHWAWHSGTPWDTHNSLASSITHAFTRLLHSSHVLQHSRMRCLSVLPAVLSAAGVLRDSFAFLVCRVRGAGPTIVLRPCCLPRSPHRLPCIHRSLAPLRRRLWRLASVCRRLLGGAKACGHLWCKLAVGLAAVGVVDRGRRLSHVLSQSVSPCDLHIFSYLVTRSYFSLVKDENSRNPHFGYF